MRRRVRPLLIGSLLQFTAKLSNTPQLLLWFRIEGTQWIRWKCSYHGLCHEWLPQKRLLLSSIRKGVICMIVDVPNVSEFLYQLR